MADLSFAVNDPLTAENFTIQRSEKGYFGSGGWSDQYTTIQGYGVVSIADDKTVDALPEADRIHEVISIHSELPLYVTRLATSDGGPATSDIVIYQGPSVAWGTYRVIKTRNYQSRGYWAALATRMAGS